MTPSSSTFASWLAGVRVLDFTAVLAGPHATRVLAQAGADVIKVEHPGVGDTTRGLPYKYAGGQSGYFNQENLGKRSLAVDLASDEGRRIVHELARLSHVVVENFRPGVTEKLGIDYESLRAIRPDLVYLSISGWGQTGPYGRMTGEVRSTTALSGLMAPDPDGRSPRTERCSFGDTNASIHGVAAVGAALYYARRTGQGCHIDLSILEALVAANILEVPEVVMSHAADAGRVEPRAGGDGARVASGNFVCADGRWLYVRALRLPAWAALADLLALPQEYRGLNLAARRQVAPEVYERLRDYCLWRTAAVAVDELQRAGASATAIATVREIVHTAGVREAGLVQELEDPFVGTVSVPTGLFASRTFTAQPQRRAPLLGEHSREVLVDLLNYTDAAVERLARAGIVTLAEPPVGRA